LFFTVHLDLVWGFTTRRAIARKNSLLFGLPTTSASGLTEDTGASKRISVKLSIRLLDEVEVHGESRLV
jgi:hypothetical protein